MTYESTKKLEPGDIIVLPVESKVFAKTEYQDEVKTLKSSWEKRLVAEYLAPKKYNLLFTGSFFNRNYNFTSENVEIKQGFQASVEYKEREVYVEDRFSYNPMISITAYTQSNADFSSDENLVAEFTPSTLVTTQLELEDRDSQFAMSAVGSYESLSTLEFDNESYQASRKNIIWGGVELSRYFYTNQNTYQLSATALRGNDFNATKYQGRLRGFIKQHYIAEIFFTQTKLDLSERSIVSDSGFSLGYRF